MDTRVLAGVLRWAASRPVWQQEAIRRLLHGELTQDDVVELADMCVDEQREGSPERTPLPSPADVEAAGDVDAVVQLVSISNVENVNALARGQNLPFGASGLTVVQGDNASGKSGYARILKRVCRARSREEVLPNAFDEAPGTPAADISFEVGGRPDTKRWTDGEEVDELQVLTAVSVYDVHATSVYIDKNNDLAYRPFGLDLYDRLVAVCDKVRSEIDQRLTTHAASEPNLDELRGEHAVGELVEELSATTTEAQVDQLAGWSDADAAELRAAQLEMEQLQKSSPTDLAKSKRGQARRSRDLANRLQRIHDVLADDKLTLYRRLRVEAASARRAADAAARTAFDEVPLAGIGTDEWRRLWEAAREYSHSHAYPTEAFPATHDDARCVLCQQELAPAASERLRAFDAFVAGQLSTEAERLAAEQETAEGRLRELDFEVGEPLLAEIEQAGGPAANEIATAFRDGESRSTAALGDWEEVPELPGLSGTNLVTRLAELATRLNEAAAELDDLEGDVAMAAAKARTLALEARQRLTSRREDVIAAIAWHRKNDQLQAARGSIDTRSITAQSKRVTKEIVSQALLDAFEEELANLGGNALPVRLKLQGREGQVLHQLELVDARPGVRPGAVLSEGEQRVAALAAFFAETRLAPSGSAIVLDDPVASVDHRYRELVVQRLFDEAQRRQVIVLTHDLVFTSELLDKFSNNGQQVNHVTVNRAAHAGIVSEDPPWELLSVSKRVRVLNKRCDEAEQLWKADDHEAYKQHVKLTLKLLREAWESAVTDVALAKAVQRFSRQVHTRNLHQVVKLTADDVALIEAGMASTSTRTHSQAPAAAVPDPDPKQLRALVKNLDSFAKEFLKR